MAQPVNRLQVLLLAVRLVQQVILVQALAARRAKLAQLARLVPLVFKVRRARLV